MAKIFDVLNTYKGEWVALDRSGAVLETAGSLQDLRMRAPQAGTFVFACGEAPR